MSAHFTIHQIKNISVRPGGTTGAPLLIEIRSDGSLPYSITLFTDDHVLNGRLAEAINGIVQQRAIEKRVVEVRIDAESRIYEIDYNQRPSDEEIVF